MTNEAMEITWPAPVDMTAKSMSTIMRMIPKVPRNVSATTGKTIPELISASVRIGTYGQPDRKISAFFSTPHFRMSEIILSYFP